ncbi:MAG: ABC transporter ATP-binding protein [Leptolyngbyaceae cyanobacterium SM1_1_3]|nr:ABC transporter ATP-binding protein [Leptolyngbyaceae cyanobacterium SM1_1_3]NJN04284.1 ABC transporter ATP-binding protein [Leptolyngbyaceae cyanobacterium RM1_1_2]NJO08499.1 ABC transporter ATP-binding protein [Leptolyngbyaceae cyanobacterium SL_1_1]
MKPSELTSYQALKRSVGMVFQAAPKELRNLALLNLLTGTGPSVSLFLSKVIIDEASRVVEQGGVSQPLAYVLAEPKLLSSIAIALGLNLLVDSVDSVGTTLFAALRDRVQGYGRGKVLEKVAYFDDIALFETPDLLNLLELSEKGLERLQRLSFIVAATLMGVFIFIPSVAVSVSIAWWIPPVLIVASVPSILVEIRHHRKSWRVEETQADLTRKMNIYAKTITSENYAKEVRLFSLQGVLLERWSSLFEQMFSKMERVRQDGALSVVSWSLIGGLGIAFPYVYVVLGVLAGTFTLGDLALYTGILLQLRRSLYILIAQTGDIYDVSLATAPIFQLLDLQPQLYMGSQRLAPTASADLATQGIQVQNVTFTYPGTHRSTLQAISFEIKPNEMVALVGENGAGKTTLAKLLCRLYDPTAGSISWNGRDLKTLDLTHLRSHIGVVMQDYARFPATLRENVGWGYFPKLPEDTAIQTALQEAGIARLTAELEQGLETPLGKQLEAGIDLSGGQWQRVAIARALMRLGQVELLVFDEPTAALDPKNEHEIYRIFRTIAQNRMSVVVSHRLALAKLCDRIIVLEQGQIIEQGNHEELIDQRGRYYNMFNRQASSYL